MGSSDHGGSPTCWIPGAPLRPCWPTLVFVGEGGAASGGTESNEPRAGLPVLFPSWLHHQVRSYKGQDTRMPVAFNMRI